MYNNGYEGDRYTVGTLVCDVDSSGSWGKGDAGCTVSQSEGRDKWGEGGRQRAKGRADVQEKWKEAEQEGYVMKRMVCVCKTVSAPLRAAL